NGKKYCGTNINSSSPGCILHLLPGTSAIQVVLLPIGKGSIPGALAIVSAVSNPKPPTSTPTATFHRRGSPRLKTVEYRPGTREFGPKPSGAAVSFTTSCQMRTRLTRSPSFDGCRLTSVACNSTSC